jgi:hypothetical protein
MEEMDSPKVSSPVVVDEMLLGLGYQEKEVRTLKKAIALKLLTNRKVRRGAVEFLKDPRADKKTLALKLASNPKMRQGAIELLKEPEVRRMLLHRITQRFRRSWASYRPK